MKKKIQTVQDLEIEILSLENKINKYLSRREKSVNTQLRRITHKAVKKFATRKLNKLAAFNLSIKNYQLNGRPLEALKEGAAISSSNLGDFRKRFKI